MMPLAGPLQYRPRTLCTAYPSAQPWGPQMHWLAANAHVMHVPRTSSLQFEPTLSNDHLASGMASSEDCVAAHLDGAEACGDNLRQHALSPHLHNPK